MWIEQLLPEQRPAYEFAVGRSGTLLIGEVGSGKTWVALATIEKLNPELVVIVCPLTAVETVWVPKLEQMLTGYALCRSWAEAKEQRARMRRGDPRGLILLLHWQRFAKDAKYLEKWDWDVAIIDEAQGAKDRESRQSRGARRLRHAQTRIALTATPLDKSPVDVWAIMRFVNVDVFGDDFTEFAAEYCRRGGYKGHQWLFRQAKMEKFLDECQNHAFTFAKARRQPVTVHLVPVTLLGEQRRLYDRMATHGIVEVGGTTIAAGLAVVRQGKLEQITGGTIIDEDEVAHATGRAKLRRLGGLAKKLSRPLVVFCKFLAEIPLIEQELRQLGERRIRVLSGAVVDSKKGKDRTQLINDFAAGKIDVLICQARTGGTAIDLTAACDMVFYSMNFSLIDFTQIIGRFDRVSQTRPVGIYVLYAEDTVDESEILPAIEAKKETFFAVVDHFNSVRAA